VARKCIEKLYESVNQSVHFRYHNRISNPISVGQSSLLLQASGGLTANVTVAVRAVIRRADWSSNPPGMTNVTGANLVWMATAHVYGGLLVADEGEVA